MKKQPKLKLFLLMFGAERHIRSTPEKNECLAPSLIYAYDAQHASELFHNFSYGFCRIDQCYEIRGNGLEGQPNWQKRLKFTKQLSTLPLK